MDPRTPAFPLLLTSLSLILSLSPSSCVLSLQAPAYQQMLQLWSQLLSQARTLDNDEVPFSHVEELQPLLDMTSSEWRDAILNAVSSSREAADNLGATVEQNSTSELCLNHTVAVVMGMVAREPWALQMLDAMGKPSNGITDGNVIWPGGYNQCLKIRANTTVVSHPYFSGRYCNLYSQPPSQAVLLPTGITITLGVCVPDTCSSEDITLLLKPVAESLNISQFNPVAACVEESRPINAKAVVAIVICSIILCLMVVGTVVDILLVQRPKWVALRLQNESNPDTDGNIDEHIHHVNTDGHIHRNATSNPEQDLLLPKAKPKAGAEAPELGVAGKVLVSFSVYTNGSKLLSTKQPPGSLTCVHGIRFLSITWVVMGHTWGTPVAIGMNMLPYIQDLNSHWSYQAITNATVSVDSFFVLSGLLVAYLTLKEMKKRDGKLNWFLFYFHRFWRLTPAYMLCLMVYICLAPYWGKGPFWPAKFVDEDFCADKWWTNLLYINNLMDSKEACFVLSWYLANDMQFYILSPLIFVPFFFSPLLGAVVSGVFLLATSITPGVLSQHYGLPPGLMQQVQGANFSSTFDYMDIYYFKPYNRMGAYIVGMLAGYFLYRTDCKLRIHWLVNRFLWAVATACALAVLYGLFESSNGHPVTVPVAAFYNAVARQVWGACVAWVVIACVTGNGGFVNTILSWSAFVPLSRLTYCIYLTHIIVLYVYTYNAYTTFYMDDLNLIFLFLGVLVASCAVAFVASMAFEAPMMGLERTFLRPAASKSGHKQ